MPRPALISMVGLPARGKTYMATKISRYLNWLGIKTKRKSIFEIFQKNFNFLFQVFNVGSYRRKMEGTSADHSFFDDSNAEAKRLRHQACLDALDDVSNYLMDEEGQVVVFDATNTTKDRRQVITKFCEENNYDLLFIESICDNPDIIETNVKEVKLFGPDYKGKIDPETALADFMRRIELYEQRYETIDEKDEGRLSFLKIFNVGEKYTANRMHGQLKSRLVYFLMNCHLVPSTIYLTRHGESEFNKAHRIGGDSLLTPGGKKYSKALAGYMEGLNIADLCVWTSLMNRTRYSAKYFTKAPVECWKALNEIDVGSLDGMSYEDLKEQYPQEAEKRNANKFTYRYPQGESYQDLVARLEPCIMELERRSNILVICHTAILRCILAYFLDKTPEELPYIEVPLHTVFKLTTHGYGCDVEMIKLMDTLDNLTENNSSTD